MGLQQDAAKYYGANMSSLHGCMVFPFGSRDHTGRLPAVLVFPRREAALYVAEAKVLRIIRRLWSVIYDLLFYIDGRGNKTLDQIHEEMDLIEALCRPYADADDIETFAEEQEGGGR